MEKVQLIVAVMYKVLELSTFHFTQYSTPPIPASGVKDVCSKVAFVSPFYKWSFKSAKLVNIFSSPAFPQYLPYLPKRKGQLNKHNLLKNK